MSVRPCHFSGSGSRHLARNVRSDTQTVSSFVLVRNSRPSTPTQSPKSSSLKIWNARSGTESCRTYTCSRDTPSDSTRKFAFPNVRTPRIRPATRVRTWLASSASPVADPWSRDDGADRRLRVEAMRVDVHAELLERVEVGAPLNDLIGFLDGAHARSSRRLMPSRTPLTNGTDSSELKARASSRASLMITVAGVSCS